MNKMKIITAVILIIFIIMPAVKAEEVFPQGESRYATKGNSIEAKVLSGNKIIINSAEGLSGRLYIVADSSGATSLDYKKVIKAENETEAGRFAEIINVIMEKVPEGIKILLQAPNPAPWSGTENMGGIEAELHLPRDCQIEINAIYFAIVVEGPFKSISNRSSFERMEAAKITENTSLTTINQDIIARDISGSVKLVTSNGDIRAGNISCPTTQAVVKNENGSIILDGFTGSFDIENSYSKIRLEQLHLQGQESRIVGSYGAIRIELVDISGTTLNVTNNNADVDLYLPKTVSAKFYLRTKSGNEIDVVGLPIQPKRIDSDRLEFVTGKAESQIIINIEGSGSISVHGR